MRFKVSMIPYTGDTSRVEPALMAARSCPESDTPLAGGGLRTVRLSGRHRQACAVTCFQWPFANVIGHNIRQTRPVKRSPSAGLPAGMGECSASYSGKRLRQFTTRKIAGPFHPAIISSRTKRRRIILGAVPSSK